MGSGVWRIDSGVEAINTLVSPKNVELFSKMSVMNKEECQARADVLHDHYVGTVEMEALTKAVIILQSALGKMHDAPSSFEKAKLARDLRLVSMVELRKVCDDAEAVVPANLWTLSTYKELLFLDTHVGPNDEYDI